GPKPPLRTKNVWSIRTRLQVEGRVRDLAMFNFAIDSKLRGCDVVRVKTEDIAPYGRSLDRVTVRQKKTGQPVRFELTEQTRQSIDEYISGTRRRVIIFSLAAGWVEVCPRANTPDLSRNGSAGLVSTRRYSGPIPFAEPRQV